MTQRVFVLLAFTMAEPRTDMIEYQDGKIALAGHMAGDDAVQCKRPGVLVVREW